MRPTPARRGAVLPLPNRDHQVARRRAEGVRRLALRCEQLERRARIDCLSHLRPRGLRARLGDSLAVLRVVSSPALRHHQRLDREAEGVALA